MIFSAVDWGGEPSPSVQFMLDAWQEELGVEVVTDLIEPDVYYYDLESVAEHVYSYGWVADYPDPENFLDLLLHSESHDSKYRNAQFDSLLIRARSEPVREIRLNFYREAEQLLMDDAGIIPLFHVKDHVLIRPHVKGFGISPFGQPDITGITLQNYRPVGAQNAVLGIQILIGSSLQPPTRSVQRAGIYSDRGRNCHSHPAHGCQTALRNSSLLEMPSRSWRRLITSNSIPRLRIAIRSRNIRIRLFGDFTGGQLPDDLPNPTVALM